MKTIIILNEQKIGILTHDGWSHKDRDMIVKRMIKETKQKGGCSYVWN